MTLLLKIHTIPFNSFLKMFSSCDHKERWAGPLRLLLALQSYFVTDDIIGCYKCMNYSDWIKVSFNVKALL